ncbi:hypothetical protein WJX81_004144 [Elliptochloris bilobata]|uniref:Uncharacterized protein n=1 Tax=Elliptochloris bilobata TaxID=381761 RepID=A0AAW1R499_9CHLO
MAERRDLPRGVFYDDRGRRWTLGGAAVGQLRRGRACAAATSSIAALTCKPEDLGCVEPGARRLQRTFAAHIWRFKDACSGAAVTEFVADHDTRSVHIPQDKRGELSASMS